MSWWNSKCTNNNGEYEITFASKEYEKAKAVEKVCCAVMDKAVKSPLDVEVVVRCRECIYFEDSQINEKGFLICPASGMEITDMDFCSYGERKEGADNG